MTFLKCPPGRIRTSDTLLKRQVLYQAELRADSLNFSIKMSAKQAFTSLEFIH